MTVRICGLALALACLIALPSSAHAARGMEVAAQDDSLLLYNAGQYMGLDSAYRNLRGFKTSRVRMNVLWGYAVTASQRRLKRKPRNVVYDFGLFDRAINAARRRGAKVQLTLSGPAPAWGTPKKRLARGDYKPKVRLWKQFVKAFARRYKRKVDRFSIWNEPNWHDWLSPLRQAPRLYRRLYVAAYKMIRRHAPRAQVLLGETSPNAQPGIAIAPLKFLRRMTCLDGRYRKKRRLSRRKCPSPLRADGVAHHPYDFDKPPWRPHEGRDNVTIASLGRLTRALDKMKRRRVLVPRRSRRMPVHLTEYGYFRSGYRKVPERRRARWTVRAFNIARKNPRVKTMLYYVVVRPPGGTNFDLSVMSADGSRTRTYRKLRGWARKSARKRQIARPGRWRA
jgi:hypothetical protein